MPPSLCETCRHKREVRTTKSRFLLCQLSTSMTAYPKYPPQPIVRCDGYESASVLIRLDTPADHDAISQVHRLAFGQEAEARLVTKLRAGGYARLSLVAEHAGQPVGHLLFSDLRLVTATCTLPALALAPLAVLPSYQRQGIGTALVRQGLQVCRQQGHRLVLVLGHAGYYPRFGFSVQLAEPLTSPFGKGASWMALELVPGALAGVVGEVHYPPPFADL